MSEISEFHLSNTHTSLERKDPKINPKARKFGSFDQLLGMFFELILRRVMSSKQ